MTTNRTWLGLIAALSIAACDSSKDSLLNGHGGGGRGGSAGTSGNAGTSGSAGTSGGGGTGGVRVCETVQCIRAIQCVRTCGGPIESTGCCPCEPPLFEIPSQACGGSSGTGGGAGGATGGSGGTTGGRGGTGGVAGSGGVGGTAGRGGSGGASGGAPGGRGGAGGTTGTAGSAGGTGGPVDGGTDARACEIFQCVRPYECKRACGGPIEYTGCCMCEAPLFDDFNGQACGDGGTGAISYVGCRFIGGIDRVVVAKRDTSRNMCVNVVFANGPAPAGLTLPSGHGLESVSVGTASACPTRQVLSTGAGPVTGTATWAPSGSPATADVDLVVTLPGNDEALIARDVNVMPACQ